MAEPSAGRARTDAAANARGRFYVLDGIDGCGKSTQATRLVQALAAPGRPAPLHLREPGSTRAGEKIRAVALERGLELDPGAEALLMAAARRQMLLEIVRPALESGRDVVCERFHPSTFAYQGAAGGVGTERVMELLAGWAGEPRPDLVVILDLPVDDALARRGAARDRMEDKGADFQRRVAEAYRRYASERPLGAPAVRIDARGSESEVFARLWTEVSRGRA